MPTKKQPHGSIEENFAPVPIHRVINLMLWGIIPMYGSMAQFVSLRPTIFVLEGYWKPFFLYRPTMHPIRYIFARFTDFHGYWRRFFTHRPTQEVICNLYLPCNIHCRPEQQGRPYHSLVMPKKSPASWKHGPGTINTSIIFDTCAKHRKLPAEYMPVIP